MNGHRPPYLRRPSWVKERRCPVCGEVTIPLAALRSGWERMTANYCRRCEGVWRLHCDNEAWAGFSRSACGPKAEDLPPWAKPGHESLCEERECRVWRSEWAMKLLLVDSL